jgi:hypothetical protein
MKIFIIIHYKYCPNFLRFKLLLEWQEINYESYIVNDISGLHKIVNQFINNPIEKNYILNIFNGSLILYDSNIIESTSHLFLKILSIKNIPLSDDFISIIGKETWIDNNFLYNFFWLSVGNNITNIFKKSSLMSEKNQVGNNILLEKLLFLENLFTNQPWILGFNFYFSDFSLFIIIKYIFDKNPNITKNYPNLYDWFLRMKSKKDWISFLK